MTTAFTAIMRMAALTPWPLNPTEQLSGLSNRDWCLSPKTIETTVLTVGVRDSSPERTGKERACAFTGPGTNKTAVSDGRELIASSLPTPSDATCGCEMTDHGLSGLHGRLSLPCTAAKHCSFQFPLPPQQTTSRPSRHHTAPICRLCRLCH